MLRSLRGQLVVSFFLVAVATPLLLIGVLYTTMGRYLRSGSSGSVLLQHARVIGNVVEARAAAGATPKEMESLLRAAAAQTPYRFVLLDAHRRVLADTAAAGRAAGTKPFSTPESDQVLLAGAPGASGGTSRESRAAVPLTLAGRRAGALLVARRRAEPMWAFLTPVNLAFRVGLGLLIAGVLGLFLSRRLLRPVDQLTRAVEALAAGDLSQRATVAPHGEIGRLAERFNYMAARVQELVNRLSAEHERLRAAHTELAESERRQRELIANVSHELRTPLACIRASSEAVLDGVADDDDKRERCLRTIEDATASLARLVQDLLTLSRIDSGEMPLHQAPVDVRRLLERCANRFLARADSRGVALDCRCEGAPTFLGDDERMAQVLSNVLDNALRHTGPAGRVCVEGRASNGTVEMRVSDTGSGIGSEHLPRVFERLYRAEKSRSKGSGGAGLGLAIAKEIVDAHHGEISIASEPGRGTTVTIRVAACP